jgi:hypothetical protein
MKKLLIDTQPLTLFLEEDKSKPGKFIARGEFARTDKATANKRFYKESLWNREIGKLAEGMSDRRVYGELDHPSDGRTKLTRVSHLMTGLRVEGNQVIGEAEVMDTPNGRILKAIMDSGGKVGVSSRGFGSTKTLSDGTEEVQEDFVLHTFDFVADPATRTAYPNIFHEERQYIEEAEMELTLETLKQNYGGLVEELERDARASALTESTTEGAALIERAKVEAAADAEDRTERRLRERFSVELRQQIEKIDEAAYERAKSEFLSDPEVAGAKLVVERVASMVMSYANPMKQKEEIAGRDERIATLEGKLAERELEVQAAQKESHEMAKMAKEAAYRLHLERNLSNDDARDTIVKLVGDVTQYESVAQIDEKVDAIREELTRSKREHDETQAVEPGERDTMEARFKELEDRLNSADERAAEAEKKVAEANDRTRRAIEVAETAALQGYKVAKAEEVSDPKVKGLIESAESTEEVDRLIESAGTPREPQQLAHMGERVRAKIARAKERSSEEDTYGGTKAKPNGAGSGGHGLLEEFGLDNSLFQRLAGGSNN